MRTEALCRTCRYLSGCALLVSKDLAFDPSRLSTDEHPKDCGRWEPVGCIQGTVRLRVMEDFGVGALAAVHMLPRPSITEQEGRVAVDFLRMAGKGVTHTERAAQLRYMTDDRGDLLLDDNGQKIPRLTYDLRKYATDPNGPVKAKETVVLFWTPSQLVDEILKAEKEAGIIILPKDKKKLEKGKEIAQQKEDNVVGRVNIKSGGAPAGIRFPITNRKVNVKDETVSDEGPGDDAPPEDESSQSDTNGFRAPSPKVRRTPGKAKQGNVATAPDAHPASAPVSAEQLMAAFAPVMQEIAEMAVKNAMEAYIKELEGLKDTILSGVKENQDVVIGGITVLHDVLVPTILDDPSRTLIDKGADILAYFEGGGGN